MNTRSELKKKHIQCEPRINWVIASVVNRTWTLPLSVFRLFTQKSVGFENPKPKRTLLGRFVGVSRQISWSCSVVCCGGLSNDAYGVSIHIKHVPGRRYWCRGPGGLREKLPRPMQPPFHIFPFLLRSINTIEGGTSPSSRPPKCYTKSYILFPH